MVFFWNRMRQAIWLFWCLLAPPVMAGGLLIDTTRIVYPEDSAFVTVGLQNTGGNIPFLVKSSVTPYRANGKAPFVVLPPLLRLDVHSAANVRIMKTGQVKNLPGDRESVFSFMELGIPKSKKRQDQNADEDDASAKVSIAVGNRVKLFWRPKSLRGNSRRGQRAETFHMISGDRVEVNNPSPFYVTFSRISVDGHELTLEGKGVDPMVAPFSKKSYRLPGGAAKMGAVVKWNTFGDDGEFNSWTGTLR